MKSKFKYLFKESIKKKIGTKWFKIVNIILLILIPCLMNIDSIIKFFGGDFEDKVNIYVVDQVNVYDSFEDEINNSYTSMLESYNVNIVKSDKSLEDLKKELKKSEEKDIVIALSKSDNLFDAEIVSFDYVDNLLYQNIVNALNKVKETEALKTSGINLALLEKAQSNVLVKRTLLNENLEENSELMTFIGGIIVIIFIIPFFFLIILIVQMIGAEINEEKTSKSMEIIISSVSPETHFMSKLISANVFAIVQGALLIIYGIIGMVVRTLSVGNSLPSGGEFGDVSSYVTAFIKSGMLDTIINGIPFFIILILLSFLAYSLLIGILASMTTSMEDYQQLQSPVMIFLLLGYYLSIIASVYDGATFIKVCSFIPFISGILAPVLYTLGQITLLDLCISIVLLGGVNYLLFKYGMKVYKVGILNYSSSKLWKKMFKSLKD